MAQVLKATAFAGRRSRQCGCHRCQVFGLFQCAMMCPPAHLPVFLVRCRYSVGRWVGQVGELMRSPNLSKVGEEEEETKTFTLHLDGALEGELPPPVHLESQTAHMLQADGRHGGLSVSLMIRPTLKASCNPPSL